MRGVVLSFALALAAHAKPTPQQLRRFSELEKKQGKEKKAK